MKKSISLIFSLWICCIAFGNPENEAFVDKINQILYSNEGSKEIEKNLSPYVKIGDKFDDFTKKNGYNHFLAASTGIGYFTTQLPFDSDIGLSLETITETGRIIRISREAKEIDGVSFKAGWIAKAAKTNIPAGYARTYLEDEVQANEKVESMETNSEKH